MEKVKRKVANFVALLLLFIPMLCMIGCGSDVYNIYLPIETITGVDTITIIGEAGDRNSASRGEDVGICIRTLSGYEIDDMVVYANKNVITTYDTNMLGNEVREYVYHLDNIASNTEITISGGMKRLEYDMTLTAVNDDASTTNNAIYDMMYVRAGTITKCNIAPIDWDALKGILRDSVWQYNDEIRITAYTDGDYTGVVDTLIDVEGLYNNLELAKETSAVQNKGATIVKTTYSIKVLGNCNLVINKACVEDSVAISLLADDVAIDVDAKVYNKNNIVTADGEVSKLTELKQKASDIVLIIDTMDSKTLYDVLDKSKNVLTINNTTIDASDISWIGKRLVISNLRLPYLYSEGHGNEYALRIGGVKNIVDNGKYYEVSDVVSNVKVEIDSFLLFDKYIIEGDDIKCSIGVTELADGEHKISIFGDYVTYNNGVITGSIDGATINVVGDKIEIVLSGAVLTTSGYSIDIIVEDISVE